MKHLLTHPSKIHTHAHIYTHTCTHPIHIHTHSCAMHTHAHIYTHTCTHLHTHVHTHTRTYLHTHMHTCTHTHTHIYTHTHTSTHTPIHVRATQSQFANPLYTLASHTHTHTSNSLTPYIPWLHRLYRLGLSFSYRGTKTHRIPYLYGSFPQKSPTISGSFAKKDLQLEVSCGSLPLCTGFRSVGCGSLYARHTQLLDTPISDVHNHV